MATNKNFIVKNGLDVNGPITTNSNTLVTNLNADLLDGNHATAFQQSLVSGTNIKTINGSSILGSGDVTISSGTVTSVTGSGPISVATGTTTPVISIQKSDATHDGYLSGSDYNSFTSHTASVSNPHSVTATQVGLGNADNTSDANKPVSTAQQTALNLKADKTITISAGTGLSGGGDLSAARTVSLATSGVTEGTYGSTTSVPVLTVDTYGRITSANTASISGSLTFTGDVTGSGTTGTSTVLTLASSGVTAGTYKSVTVDSKGRVTTGSNPTTLAGYGIIDAALNSHSHSLVIGNGSSPQITYATTDTLHLVAGSNVSLSYDDINNKVTIASSYVDTNTTYDHLAITATDGATLRLHSSAGVNDDVKLASGSNVTVSYTDDNTITISSTDTNTTYSAGTGLTLTGTVFSANYGTTATTACVGNDIRLSDARTPTAHNQAWSTITGTPTTLAGYGITDAVGSSDSRLTNTRNTTNTITFTTTGGAASGITFDGSVARIIDYSTLGAAPASHTHSYQAADGDLLAIAGLTGTSGFLKKTAVDTWALDTNTYLTSISSSNVTTALGYTPYNSTNPSGYTSNLGTVTSVTATSPVASTGGTTPVISMSQASGSVNGYLSSTDWTTFNNKQPAGSYLVSGGALGTPSSGTLTNCTFPTLNQDTTGKSAKTDALNSATTVINVSSATAPTTGQVLTATDSTHATWQTPSSGGSTITIANKTAAYTVVAGDAGKVINCTSGTFTVSLTAATTLGAGFNVTIWNTGTLDTDVITIDPNGSETINGADTLSLRIGEGCQIICDGTNWQANTQKYLYGVATNFGGYATRPIASGANSIAVGLRATSTNSSTVAIGYGADATGSASLALGFDPTASSSYSTAIGTNSSGSGSQAVTGAGAMALGGSYASGTDSFAAAIASNSSSYGAVDANSVAIGPTSKASRSKAVVIGEGNIANGRSAKAIGSYCEAAADYSVVIGLSASDNGIIGKRAYSSGAYSVAGDAQQGLYVLRMPTSDGSPRVLTTNIAPALTNNQIILPNYSAYAYSGTIVARQKGSDGTKSAAWKIEGLVRREANAASTVLVSNVLTTLSNVPGWTLAVTADTTNGGLALTATGAAATNIRWVATIQTSELTYA